MQCMSSLNLFKFLLSFVLLAPLTLLSCTKVSDRQAPEIEVIDHFISFFDQASDHQVALDYLRAHWQDSYAIMAVEVIYLNQDPLVTSELLGILSEKTGQRFAGSINEWYQWIWHQEPFIVDNYGDFKSKLYEKIDPKFSKYFLGRTSSAKIRLDEVQWGGVRQDGIPPLRNPKMILADAANFMEDDHIVFGIEVNGDYRAYPKRILAWHEMFVDEVGGVPLVGVYCTLCGTMILYDTEVNGVKYQMGTSGFLYRSNKLMYDKATQSLWNTLWGEPVIGPLAGQGIQLPHRSVVTTTWGEWKGRHPQTSVLSLDTGHSRNYDEGVAYEQYFATDRLMFEVPFHDKRLMNKEEVLALRFPEYPQEQLAIATSFLNKRSLYTDSIDTLKFIVLTDRTGANRVYKLGNQAFKNFDQDRTLVDSKDEIWTLYEDKLYNNNTGESLARLPYHRAFWFGWHAAFPNTRLVK